MPWTHRRLHQSQLDRSVRISVEPGRKSDVPQDQSPEPSTHADTRTYTHSFGHYTHTHDLSRALGDSGVLHGLITTFRLLKLKIFSLANIPHRNLRLLRLSKMFTCCSTPLGASPFSLPPTRGLRRFRWLRGRRTRCPSAPTSPFSCASPPSPPSAPPPLLKSC